MTNGTDTGPPPFPTTPEADTLLSIRGLIKTFTLHAVDGRTVVGLDGVDLDVAVNHHVALAGLSGAGKSSLLKCVHRTYVAQSGHIHYRTAGAGGGDDGDTVDLLRLDDTAMADLREREIGYVSQFLRAEPRRGVFDVVARSARRLGAADDEAADMAAAVLRRVNIAESLWETYPTLLSGGEKQRVNLAAGIVVAPRLLLLDEPVSALDPANRQAVLDVVAELTARGATVLSVFHDLDAMGQLADRIVVMANGRVVDDGPASDVLDRGLELVPT